MSDDTPTAEGEVAVPEVEEAGGDVGAPPVVAPVITEEKNNDDTTSSTAATASDNTPVSSTPLAPSKSSAPQIPESEMTPEQLRAKKLFDRWQKTFLGAIDKQSEDYILSMLKEGEDLVNSGLLDLNRMIKPASGSTFLHTAAWFHKQRIMEWLLAHGANPNEGNLKGNTPLHLLCEQADKGDAPRLIQIMLDYGGDVEIKDAGDVPASAAEKALAVGFDVRTLNYEKGKQYLARKAQGGAAEEPTMSEEERQAAVDKSKLVYRKLSTLFLGLEAEGVSQAVDDAIVRIITANTPLIQQGILDVSAPPLASEGNQKTFVHYAVLARRPEILRVLLLAIRGGPRTAHIVDLQDEGGDTALHYAVANIEEGQEGVGESIVVQLLESGASTTLANYLKGQNPLQMLPPSASTEVRSWLSSQVALSKQVVANRKQQELTSPSIASRILGAGAASAGGSANAATSSPIPGMGPGSGNAERQDRAGARALMARLANAVNPGASSPGGGVSSPVPGAKSGALGLIQKSAMSAGASAMAGRRSSGNAAFSGALQSLMANKNAQAGGAGAPGATPASGTRSIGGLGSGVGAFSASKKLLNDRSLHMDELWSILDIHENNSLQPVQLVALHEELHCCRDTCTLGMVQQVLDASIPIGQCTRSNALEVLAMLELLCTETANLKWDFRLVDDQEIGAISTMDTSGGLYPSSAELVWGSNYVDSNSQLKYDEFLSRKMGKAQEKEKPKEIKWVDMAAELVGKVPSLVSSKGFT